MYTAYPTFIGLEDGVYIPLDPANPDYARYLEWIAQGNTPGEPPEPSIASLIVSAVAEIRLQRQPIIEILDGLQGSELTAVAAGGDAAPIHLARAQAIDVAKQGLRDLTNIDLTTCTTYEEMRLKVKTAYYALAAALPADLRLAFKEAIS